jgi:hypothetical protein
MKFVKTFENFKKKSLLEYNLNPEVDEPEIDIEPEVEPEVMPEVPPMPDYPPTYEPDEDGEGDDEGIERPEVDPVPLAEKPASEEETIRQIVARINKEG